MEKVPNIISTKDLSYISDGVEWNYNAAKKACHYEKQVTDEEIANELNKLYNMHKKIAENLLKMIGGKK